MNVADLDGASGRIRDRLLELRPEPIDVDEDRCGGYRGEQDGHETGGREEELFRGHRSAYRPITYVSHRAHGPHRARRNATAKARRNAPVRGSLESPLRGAA